MSLALQQRRREINKQQHGALVAARFNGVQIKASILLH